MVFSFILQNDGSKPKFFWVKRETKHTLTSVNGANYYLDMFKLTQQINDTLSTSTISIQ
jgi:hypothetical protein